MKVSVAGASGAMGKPLVKALLSAGHQGFGMATRQAGVKPLRAQGLEGVVLNALEAAALEGQIAKICPDAMIDGPKSLPKRYSPEATVPRLRTASALIFILAVVLTASAQPDSLRVKFDSTLSQHGVVGGALSVIKGSAKATEYFHGEAQLDTHQPIDAATAYNWASITKTLTAIAILQLRDRGLLSLGDPAVRYVPELRQVHDSYGSVDAITIRHLLTHTAGFRNPTWPWDCDDPANCNWQPFEPTRWSQVEAMLPYTHVAFKPGSRWSYSNPGYVFLGQIIERLTGEDFEVYVTKNILMPLGMTQSYFDRAPYFLEPKVSASYLRAGSKVEPQPFNFDTGITTSNSGLKAPIVDMEKYARFLLGEPGNKLYELVLRRGSLEEAWTAVIPAMQAGEAPTAYTSGPHGAQPQMGLGFFILNIPGNRYVYHDGDQGGFSSELLLDPGRHCASILVVNTTDTGSPADATHTISNTEPDPHSDLRIALRNELVDHVFPACAGASK